MMKSVAGIALCLFAGAALAQQDDSGLTARQIFDLGIKAPVKTTTPTTPKGGTTVKVKPADKPIDKPVVKGPTQTPVVAGNTPENDGSAMMTVAYTPLALRYSILQQKGKGFVEVDPETHFRSGDRIRVKVEANDAAFLYIVMGGSSGQWRVLFPSKEIDGGNNRIAKGQTCTIPPESDPAFYFDETAGVEKVSLVLSRSPEPDLEKLIYAAGDPTRAGEQKKLIMARNDAIDDSVVGGMREKLVSRDLVFEKVDGPAVEGKSEKAVYAATRDKSSNARLFVDLQLIHK